jgi:hypothetical protein
MVAQPATTTLNTTNKIAQRRAMCASSGCCPGIVAYFNVLSPYTALIKNWRIGD